MPTFKKIINNCLLACIGLLVSFQSTSFKADQLKQSRVKAAYKAHWNDLQALLVSSNIDKDNFNLYLRIFKEEGLLELWAKNGGGSVYTHVKSYPVCAKSGSAGPKRRQGDGQVPEGFYEISAFQPQSTYHLALKVNYPNKSDRLKAASADPGGDIMIHGKCVTIGCIPIQDGPIEELYVLCVEAKNKGAIIYTDIFPFKFEGKNLAMMAQLKNPELAGFWSSLKKACDYFDVNKKPAKITTNAKGTYLIDTP